MLKYAASWIGKYIVLPVVIILALYGVYLYHSTRERPAPPKPEVVISEADRRCYAVAAWDDAYDEDELIFVTFAVMNLSKRLKMQPCDTYKEALTIRAPSQPLHPLLKMFGRKITVVETWAKQFVGSNAWQARAEQTVEKVLKDPSPYLAQHPWLECVERYIRSKNRTLAWTNQEAMRTEMRLVHTSTQGAEYFCPK